MSSIVKEESIVMLSIIAFVILVREKKCFIIMKHTLHSLGNVIVTFIAHKPGPKLIDISWSLIPCPA